MSLNAEDVARIYNDVRKDVMLYLQYEYGCSVEDAMDAVQDAMVYLLNDATRYNECQDDGVIARVYTIAKSRVINGHKHSEYVQIAELEHEHRRRGIAKQQPPPQE